MTDEIKKMLEFSKEFIAVKRTEKSSWQFDVYSDKTKNSFDAIAPDGGNYKTKILIDIENVNRLKRGFLKLMEQRDIFLKAANLDGLEYGPIKSFNAELEAAMKGEET